MNKYLCSIDYFCFDPNKNDYLTSVRFYSLCSMLIHFRMIHNVEQKNPSIAKGYYHTATPTDKHHHHFNNFRMNFKALFVEE